MLPRCLACIKESVIAAAVSFVAGVPAQPWHFLRRAAGGASPACTHLVMPGEGVSGAGDLQSLGQTSAAFALPGMHCSLGL